MLRIALVVSIAFVAIALVVIPTCTSKKREPEKPSKEELAKRSDSLRKAYRDSLKTVYGDSALVDADRLDPFSVRWYSSHLHRMNEKKLSIGNDARYEVWRITVLPSFSIPFCIRISFLPNNKMDISYATDKPDSLQLLTVVFKSTYGAAGYGGGPLRYTMEVQEGIGSHPLSDTILDRKWSQLRAHINQMNFWSQTDTMNVHELWTDGTIAILEGVSNGKYHFVERQMRDSSDQKNVVDRMLPIILRDMISMLPTLEHDGMMDYLNRTYKPR